MANTYYDATGVLILNKVTPVITALFGCFNLNAEYPGEGEAYIAIIAEENSPSWDEICEALTDLAQTLSVDVTEASNRSISSVLRRLAAHFGTSLNPSLMHIIDHGDFDSDPELAVLFAIAQAFDDGHGLSAIKFEGAWHCSKPRLFEFGGHGTYISTLVSVQVQSAQALELGVKLHDILARGDLDSRIEQLAAAVSGLLSGVTNESNRRLLQRKLATLLLEG
jgi:hypothetical protein